MNILFRVDGSVTIGMGHIVRCMALAQHLKHNYNCNLYFALRFSDLGKIEVGRLYEVISSNEIFLDYGQWLIECIHKVHADVLILDARDGLSLSILEKVKLKTGVKIGTIDDPEEKRLAADWAFYPPVSGVNNLNWEGYGGSLYVGWEYVILRKEFLLSTPKRPEKSIPVLLVAMGGADEGNLTASVTDLLKESRAKFSVIVMVGSGYPHLEDLRSSLRSANYSYELYQNPDNVASVMSQADFGVITFGQTAYEFAALKIPAIYLCISEDHFESSKLFVENGLGVSMGTLVNMSDNDLSNCISRFVTQKMMREKMSAKAEKLSISKLDYISQVILS